jgi:hypothetical protein
MHHRLSAVFVPRTSCVTRDHVFVDSGLCTAPHGAHAQRAQGARPDATNENFASAQLTLLRVKWQDAISMSLVTNVSCQVTSKQMLHHAVALLAQCTAVMTANCIVTERRLATPGLLPQPCYEQRCNEPSTNANVA